MNSIFVRFITTKLDRWWWNIVKCGEEEFVCHRIQNSKFRSTRFSMMMRNSNFNRFFSLFISHLLSFLSMNNHQWPKMTKSHQSFTRLWNRKKNSSPNLIFVCICQNELSRWPEKKLESIIFQHLHTHEELGLFCNHKWVWYSRCLSYRGVQFRWIYFFLFISL